MVVVKQIGLVVLVFGMVAAFTGPAPAGYTYNISLSVANNTGDFEATAGPDSVTGTITVDKFGTLGAADILSYSLTFSSPDNLPVTLTTADSTFFLDNVASLTSSNSGLSITLPAYQPNQSITYLEINSTHLFDVHLILGNPIAGSSNTLVIANYPTQGTSIEDYGQSSLNSSAGAFTLGTPAFSSVPEPSSLVLCGIAGLIGLGVAKGRRKVVR